ncbi:hypothetical protein [Streptomyces sp. AC602_WCS936]|uniref:hypothetical protein n=1 Tax=Streptomyces sp. AC602_WCS936 TaxID=2823685 RepID=UPI001C2700D2|nr:hypothetical protein [Streptomyces sp. AC602_WCS936]
MRIIDGTPEEIVEYERLTGRASRNSLADAALSPDESAEAQTAEETTALSTAAPLPAADHVALMKFIYGRAGKNPERTFQTERFIKRLLDEEEVVVAFGRSSKTPDGLADYLMIRDNGPQRYGAVAYLRPINGGLTIRLGPDDLHRLGIDGTDDRIQLRSVAPSDPYKLNCPLAHDEAAELASTLVRAALAIVRSE